MPATPNINAEKIQGNLSLTTLSATTYYNLPTDIRVTGGTYSNGTTIFTNNTGGTFSVTGFTVGGGSTFTGGTVTGSTNFTNTLSANTFIATSVTATTFDTVSFTSDTINIAVTPTNNNANTQVLTRNSSTGDVQYKDTSSFMTTGKIIALTQITYF